MKEPVPELLVEKLALDELSAAQAASVRERLGEHAQRRLDALAASDAEILEALPPSLVAAQVREAVKRSRPPAKSRWTPWLATAAVAAALLLWGLIGGTVETADPAPTRVARADPAAAAAGTDADSDAVRFKGGTTLWVSRFADGQSQRLATGDRVAAGQTLQVEYAAGDARHGVIVSIDGAGKAWLHFPDTVAGDSSLRGRASLSHGYELDDAPGFERFFFVTTDAAGLSVAEVLQAAQALAASERAANGELQLSPGLRQQSLRLDK